MTDKNRYHKKSCGETKLCGYPEQYKDSAVHKHNERNCHTECEKCNDKYQYNEYKGCGSDRCDILPLAMAYVVMQSFGKTYSPETAICKGTLFPDLDKPFCGKRI